MSADIKLLHINLWGGGMAKMGCLLFLKGLKNVHIIPFIPPVSHVPDASESVQRAQASVEGEVHAQVLPGQSAHPGGGAVAEGRTAERGVSGNVSPQWNFLQQRLVFPA